MSASARNFALALPTLMGLSVAPAAAAASFTFKALVLPNSSQNAFVTGIYQDQAVGWGNTSDRGLLGFVWSAGNYTVLPSIPQLISVSDNGLAVGYASSSSYSIYSLTSGVTNTYSFAPMGGVYFVLGAINAVGTVAATQVTAVQHGRRDVYFCRPFTQDTTGTYTYLTNAAKPKLVAYGLTDAGTVIAAPSSCPYPLYNVDLYKNGKFKPFTFPGGNLIEAWFINGNGLFGGSYDTGDQLNGYTSTGGKATIYAAPGAAGTVVTGVDAHGNVAGYTYDSTGAFHGFIYSKKQYYEVDYPGHKSTTITGISSTGAIIGYFGDAIGSGQMPNQPFVATCASDNGCTK